MEGIWDDMQEEAVNQMLAVSLIGGKERVKADLQSFLAQTGVDEIMATSHIYDHTARLYSYQLLADIIKGA